MFIIIIIIIMIIISSGDLEADRKAVLWPRRSEPRHPELAKVCCLSFGNFRAWTQSDSYFVRVGIPRSMGNFKEINSLYVNVDIAEVVDCSRISPTSCREFMFHLICSPVSWCWQS